MDKEIELLFLSCVEMLKEGHNYDELDAFVKKHIPDPKERYSFLEPFNEYLIQKEKAEIYKSNALSYKIVGGLFMVLGITQFLLTFPDVGKIYSIIDLGIFASGLYLWHQGKVIQRTPEREKKPIQIKKGNLFKKK